MATYYITLCDNCYPGTDPRVVLLDEDPRGVAYCDEASALASGWEERDYGIVCPECAKDEAERAARDDEQGAENSVGHNEVIDKLINFRLASDILQGQEPDEGSEE